MKPNRGRVCRCREHLVCNAGGAVIHADRVLSAPGQDAYAAGDGEEQDGCAREFPDHHQGGGVRLSLSPHLPYPSVSCRLLQFRSAIPWAAAPTAHGGTEACYEVVRLRIPWSFGSLCSHSPRSAANDFWGKQFMSLTGEKKMTQNLAIATGCAAGATESFVVVPFELVKIKCVVPTLHTQLLLV